jgi:hypothetical protein
MELSKPLMMVTEDAALLKVRSRCCLRGIGLRREDVFKSGRSDQHVAGAEHGVFHPSALRGREAGGGDHQ